MIKTVIGICLLLLLMLPAFETNCLLAEIHTEPRVRKKKVPPAITMWSIIKKRKSYTLTKRLVSRKSIDKMIAEGGGPNLDVEPIRKGDKSLLLPGDGHSIAYFADIGEFQPGAVFAREFQGWLVNTFNFPPKNFPVNSSRTFELNGLKYRISAAVQPSDSNDGLDMQVYLVQERKKQRLCSFRQASDAIASLDWIADIDRDGRADLLLSTAGHYASVTTTLYLSSRARPGALVGAVARFAQAD